MRNIKFRAWFPNKHWVTEKYGQMINDYTSMQLFENFGFFDEEIIYEQYTGLKDKNGVEIYEGDIIEFHGNYTSIEKCGRGKRGVVTWDLDGMGFDLYVKDLGYYDVSTETDEWHYKRLVIGNIHENKELL